MGLDISMLVPGMAIDPEAIGTKSLGGSETAGYYMARELAKLGHFVNVFANVERPGVYENVQYRPASQFAGFVMGVPQDVCVVQRAPEAFSGHNEARLNLLWCHDLALLRQAQPFRGTLWNIDKALVVSQFMADQYKQVYQAPEDVLWVTRNGVELERFERLERALRADGIGRNRKKLLYCARPERGLDVLLGNILPKLLARDAGLQLCLALYDNTVPQMEEFYAEIHRMAAAFGDRVLWLGALGKDALYEHFLTAGLYIYPTPGRASPQFREVSCISAMEAQAAGLPMVTSASGALPETLSADAGVLVAGDPWSPEYQEQFVGAVLKFVNDDDAWQRASHAGRKRAQSLDWVGVARDWSEGFGRLLAERNNSPHRLAHHLIRQSDIVAARALLEPLTDEHAQELKARLDQHWGFMRSPEGIRGQYEKIGQTHRPSFEGEGRETRHQVIGQWFVEHPDLKKILDYGCAHGAYTVNFSNRLPDRTFFGVDIDKYGIMWAEKFRAEKGTSPGNLTFRLGDQDVDLSDVAPFDAAFLGETLEHTVEPWTVLTKIERWVKPGGKVLITVPYGPWEYLSFESYPHRAHIWHFDYHDLRDMIGHKKMSINTVPAGSSYEGQDTYGNPVPLGQMVGWHIVEYTVDHQPCRPIDMQRHLRVQRPRQTLSANIMAGKGAEENLHWCLRSIKNVVDEIVIVDTGMTTEGRRIAEKYTARIVPGPDPKLDGFEAPRNVGLKYCRMDWVLWIDTDEKLVEPANLLKYLRENSFNGYSIRQHHFACDTTFKPDLPVRVFRNRPYDGKAMRWYGKIHEHPELGLNEGPGPAIVLGDVHIAHVGYLIESGRRTRFWRNYPMLQKDREAYPNRLLQKHFVMRDNMLLTMYTLQQNGGKVTPQVRGWAEETIALWRQYFRGRAGYMNVDSLSYYSDACRVLGLGFEAAFQVAAGKDQANPEAPLKYRFATEADFMAEVEWRSKDAVAPYASEWW